jgi:aminoglycoside phosphotransferase (APT) family kinase protein
MCADPSIIGTPFYLMERIRGRIFHHASLEDVASADRISYYLAHARSLAALHKLDWRGLGLGRFARPGSFLERQIRRWTQVWGDERAADISYLRRWLLQHQPSTGSRALIHGDYKFNNLVFDERAPRLVAVLDWELAAIGDPMLDLAHCWCATWATTPDEYGGILGLELERHELPTADAYIAAYEEAAGTTTGLPEFYLVLALLRYAGIFLGIGQRARAGTAAATNASTQGRLAYVYLDRALDLASESVAT